jgi:hypothetical protein
MTETQRVAAGELFVTQCGRWWLSRQMAPRTRTRTTPRRGAPGSSQGSELDAEDASGSGGEAEALL